MEPTILHEDENILVINKPAGIMTHPDGVGEELTVSDWFAREYPASATVGETQRLKDGTEILRPGVVHRLDRDTSGVLVLAKTPQAHAFLKEAFQAHNVRKMYLAFVYGIPKEPKGTITFPIGRSRKDFRLRSAQPKAKGMLRDAITHYKTVGTIGKHTLLTVEPETGRTHQIRVHLKAIHHPVVCDPLYAPNHKCDLGFKRLGLHAFTLDLPTMDGGRISVTAPLPDDLQAAVRKFPGTESLIAPV